MLFKKHEVLSINDVLNSLKGAYSPRVKYWISKNKKILSTEVKSLEEARESNSTDFKEFSKSQSDLLRECLEFGADDQPVAQGHGYKLLPGKAEHYKAEAKRLEEKHSMGLSERKKEIEVYNALLDEETEVDVYLLDNSEIPDSIDQASYDVLFPLIKEL